MSIGNRIKQARLVLGMSQEELAKSVGVTKGAIGNYETDVSRPKEQILVALMKVLNIDANYIYQDYIQSTNLPAKKNDIDFSEHEKSLILAYRARPDMQPAVNTLLGIAKNEESADFVTIYRAAQSAESHEDEIISVPRDFIQRLKDAPETDDIL